MPSSPRQTVIRLGLRLHPGPLGVELVPVDGECVVLSKNDGASPLEAGDVVESINGTAMTRLRGGMFAWRDLLSAGGDAVVRRAVTVRRRAAPEAEAGETDQPTRYSFDFDGMEILDDPSSAANTSSTNTDEAVRAAWGGGSTSDAGDVGARVGPTLTPSERWARRNDPPPAGEAEGPTAAGEQDQGETAAERWLREKGAARQRERRGEGPEGSESGRAVDEETTSAEGGMSEHFENSAGPEEGEGGSAAAAATDGDGDGDGPHALLSDHDAPVTPAIVEAPNNDVSDELDRAETGRAVAAADEPPVDDPLAELRRRYAQLQGKDKGKEEPCPGEEEPCPRVPRWKTLTRTAMFFALLGGGGYGLGRGVFYLISSRNPKEDTIQAAARPSEGENGMTVPSAAPRLPTRSPADDLFG